MEAAPEQTPRGENRSTVVARPRPGNATPPCALPEDRRTLERRLASLFAIRRSVPAPLPFAGRDAELAVLRDALARAGTGAGVAVFVVGEGGIGKTRLTAEVAAEAAAEGWQVARGAAYAAERGIPYAPFTDALLPLFGGAADPPVPLLDGSGPSGGSDRARGPWEFGSWLAARAAERPLLLLLDNVQWADPSSAELLHLLARQIAGARIFLLGTLNPGEAEPNAPGGEAVRSLAAAGAARVLALEPLAPDAVAELARAALGEVGAASVASRLYARTRGNPLFAGEILREMAERGGGGEDEALPPSIREAVLARLARLSDSARRVADTAAVAGAEIPHRLLRTLGGGDEDALLAATDELLRRGVLLERSVGGEVSYTPGHPIVAATLYAEIPAARRQWMHGSVAAALEALHASCPDEHAGELAFHFDRSGDPAHREPALRYSTVAGRSALWRHANREAAEHLEVALRIAGDGPERPTLLPELARARQRLGEYGAALALWSEARETADAASDRRQSAEIRRRTGLIHLWRGEPERALAEWEAGLAAADEADDPRLGTRLRLARSGGLQEIGRIPKARADAEHALALSERLEDPSLRARAHRALLLLGAWTGPFAPAREHGRRAVALAGEAGEEGVACSAEMILAMLEGLTGHPAAAADHIRAAEAGAERLGSPVLALHAAELAVEHAAATGDWGGGLARARAAIGGARLLGQRTLLARLLVWTGLLELARGDPSAAERLDEAWEMTRPRPGIPLDVHAAVPAHTGRAALHLARGEYAAARETGERGLAIADRGGYLLWAVHRLLPLVAEAYLWLADADGAERLGGRLRAAGAGAHRAARAWAEACDGVVARLRGDLPAAADGLRRGVAELEALPLVFDAARLRRQLAQVLAESGDTAAAARELRAAHEVFTRLGAAPELENTRVQLRTLGARPPARVAPASEGVLTPHEWEIARLAASGASNKAIGRTLNISPRTAGTHLANLYRKLGVGSRMELGEWVRRASPPA